MPCHHSNHINMAHPTTTTRNSLSRWIIFGSQKFSLSNAKAGFLRQSAWDPSEVWNLSATIWKLFFFLTHNKPRQYNLVLTAARKNNQVLSSGTTDEVWTDFLSSLQKCLVEAKHGNIKDLLEEMFFTPNGSMFASILTHEGANRVNYGF